MYTICFKVNRWANSLRTVSGCRDGRKWKLKVQPVEFQSRYAGVTNYKHTLCCRKYQWRKSTRAINYCWRPCFRINRLYSGVANGTQKNRGSRKILAPRSRNLCNVSTESVSEARFFFLVWFSNRARIFKQGSRRLGESRILPLRYPLYWLSVWLPSTASFRTGIQILRVVVL